MTKKYTISVLGGDGTGPEVVEQAIKVLSNTKKEYDLDSNTHGEERAFVMSGQYEKYMPIDIFPVHLIKSILIEDISIN